MELTGAYAFHRNRRPSGPSDHIDHHSVHSLPTNHNNHPPHQSVSTVSGRRPSETPGMNAFEDLLNEEDTQTSIGFTGFGPPAPHPPPMEHEPSTKHQEQDMDVENGEDMNPMNPTMMEEDDKERMEDLFNDTITSGIDIPIPPPQGAQAHTANPHDSRSFDSTTKHLQVNEQDTKQSTAEFDVNLQRHLPADTIAAESMMVTNAVPPDAVNNGSFNDVSNGSFGADPNGLGGGGHGPPDIDDNNINQTMPALESPHKNEDQALRRNDDPQIHDQARSKEVQQELPREQALDLAMDIDHDVHHQNTHNVHPSSSSPDAVNAPGDSNGAITGSPIQRPPPRGAPVGSSSNSVRFSLDAPKSPDAISNRDSAAPQSLQNGPNGQNRQSHQGQQRGFASPGATTQNVLFSPPHRGQQSSEHDVSLNDSNFNPTGYINARVPAVNASDVLSPDHTFRIEVPPDVFKSPTSKEQQRQFTRRRSSMHRPHHPTDTMQLSTPNTVVLPKPVPRMESVGFNHSSLDSSMFSDRSHLGSVTKAFRVEIPMVDKGSSSVSASVSEDAMNREDGDGDGGGNGEDGDELDTSLGTLMQNIETQLLHEQYQHIQQNEDIDPEAMQGVRLDDDAVVEQRQHHRYSLNRNKDDPQSDPEAVQEEQPQTEREREPEALPPPAMDWRTVAAEYEWFPKPKSLQKYSLGMRGRSSVKEMEQTLTDPQQIVLQQCCDRVERDAREQLVADIGTEMEEMRASIKHLESSMNGDNALIAKIRSVMAQGDEAAKRELMAKVEGLKAFCRSKVEIEIKEKRSRTLDTINEGMTANQDKLAADLERLKAIRDKVNAECAEQQQQINRLRECETNPSLANLQRRIFENDQQIDAQKERRRRYKEMLAEQRAENERLTEKVSVCEQSLADLSRDIESNEQLHEEATEIADTTWFLQWVSAVAIHKMTADRIELVVMRWFMLSMDYGRSTLSVSNVEWKMHSSPEMKDKFSAYLLGMVLAIGERLQLTTSIRSVSDLKRSVMDIMELIQGIQELRRTLTMISKSLDADYMPVIRPLNASPKVEAQTGELVVQLSMARDLEYPPQSGGDLRMRSRLVIDALFRFKLGYPRNGMRSEVSTVLVRQQYDERSKRFQSDQMKRVELMFMERRLNALIHGKIANLEVAPNLFARAVNVIQSEMDVIMDNEAQCVHSIDAYDL